LEKRFSEWRNRVSVTENPAGRETAPHSIMNQEQRNQITEKLLLARTRVQNLFAQQDDIVAAVIEELGLKNASEVLARSYIEKRVDEKWLMNDLNQLLFLLSDLDA